MGTTGIRASLRGLRRTQDWVRILSRNRGHPRDRILRVQADKGTVSNVCLKAGDQRGWYGILGKESRENSMASWAGRTA